MAREKSQPVNTDKEDIQSIELLTEKVRTNKKRVEQQKQEILNKIDELKKELNSPTYIKGNMVDSFSIEDIENNVEPKESKGEIAKKNSCINESI